jgi:putative transposase
MLGMSKCARVMLCQHLHSVHKRRFVHTTDSTHAKPIAQNTLRRRFDGWSLNRAWVGDITYIKTDEGRLYLATVVALASRKVVGWSMSDRMKTELVLQALRSAYSARKPEPGLIMNTDRGSQFADRKHIQLLSDYRMVRSMSREGSCWNTQSRVGVNVPFNLTRAGINEVAESFF